MICRIAIGIENKQKLILIVISITIKRVLIIFEFGHLRIDLLFPYLNEELKLVLFLSLFVYGWLFQIEKDLLGNSPEILSLFFSIDLIFIILIN